MLSVAELNEFAREMKEAQDEARQISPFSLRVTKFDVHAAYAVAYLVHQERVREGSTPVGRKIGFTNPDMWALYGVREPIWAFVYDTTVMQLSAAEAICPIRHFAEPKIEPEIVLHFRSQPVSGDPAEILACIDWIAHGVEIVQAHFPGWKFQSADAIADSALHGTLLVGEPLGIERFGADVLTMLERCTVTLSCNGRVREVGKGANVLGSPLAATAHVIGVLAKQQSLPLQANELVTTGTMTPALSVSAGETWRTEMDGIALPGISVQFTA